MRNRRARRKAKAGRDGRIKPGGELPARGTGAAGAPGSGRSGSRKSFPRWELDVTIREESLPQHVTFEIDARKKHPGLSN